MKPFKPVFICLLILSFNLYAQDAKKSGLDAITNDAMSGMLEFLSSDWMMGRATGTEGEYMAADYIATMFKVFGVQPAGDMSISQMTRALYFSGIKPVEYRSYFQNFSLVEISPGENQVLDVIRSSKSGDIAIHYSDKTDFRIFPGQLSQSGTAAVIFAGYGISDSERKFDEYQGINAKGKIVLRMSGYPGKNDTASAGGRMFRMTDRRAEYNLMNSKDEAARKSGAIAIIEFDPFQDMYKGLAANIPFRYNSELNESDTRPTSFYDTRLELPSEAGDQEPPVFYVSTRVAMELLRNNAIDPVAFSIQMANTPRPASLELSDTKVHFSTSSKTRIIQVRNVVGMIEGKNKDEIIVVGGHYDHLGKFNGAIWNGADDNASGTVGVLGIAKACMATGQQPEKTIVFAAWTAEEKGLLGSQYFAKNPAVGKKIILNLNYDMISRDDKSDSLGLQCRMSYTKSYPVLESISRRNNEQYRLGLEVNYRPAENASGGSDHAPFAKKGIPYLYFMAGFPPEYHQPNDHFNLVNTKKMTAIIQLGFLNIWDLANSQGWNK